MSFEETKSEIIDLEPNLKSLLRIWLPENEPEIIFLAVHGLLAHSGDWVTLASYFKNKGIATYAADLRFHGTHYQHNKSKNIGHVDSYDDYVKDVNVVLDIIKSKHPSTPVFLVGHSMGGMISLIFGLKIPKSDSNIKGIIISSPWLENKVKVNRILLSLSKILAKILPKLAIKAEPLNNVLTRDKEITKRHFEDEEKGLRISKVTPKFGVNTFKTQEWVLNNIKEWSDYPLFSVISGNDHIAVSEVSINAIKTVNPDLSTLIIYKDNYHENFNEINREEIYEKIDSWIRNYL
ncbi:MAG: Phospholipase YtpA [Candidatus Heimdallarchaeota archaeon LC_3]|nr:MAG: Phospholipase YtpA [Candidatus Heimdallarchaeota archaeon LC_3]